MRNLKQNYQIYISKMDKISIWSTLTILDSLLCFWLPPYWISIFLLLKTDPGTARNKTGFTNPAGLCIDDDWWAKALEEPVEWNPTRGEWGAVVTDPLPPKTKAFERLPDRTDLVHTGLVGALEWLGWSRGFSIVIQYLVLLHFIKAFWLHLNRLSANELL